MIHLLHRSVLKIKGPDSVSFLQGLITQDLLKTDAFQYSLLLSPQGKFQYDLFIWQEDHCLYLDTERADELLKKLSMYKLRSQVSIEMTDLKVYVDINNSLESDFRFNDPRHPAIGSRIYTSATLECTQTLDDYDDHRLALCIPDGARDMTVDRSIPLEWNMDALNAISWTKGCYMGQELTSRTKHLNLIQKRIVSIPKSSFDETDPSIKLIKEYKNFMLCFLRDKALA